jgi:hypothetical protein
MNVFVSEARPFLLQKLFADSVLIRRDLYRLHLFNQSSYYTESSYFLSLSEKSYLPFVVEYFHKW